MIRLAAVALGLASGVRKLHRTSKESLDLVVTCTGSTIQCNGAQCCPGIPETNYLNFPCPNAPAGWNNCEGPAPGNPSPSPPSPSPPGPPSTGGGCCRFEADCGDCGEDGTGWCHQSASNCEVCTGVFDPSASAPSCGGSPSPPGPSPPGPPAPPGPTPPAPAGTPVE